MSIFNDKTSQQLILKALIQDDEKFLSSIHRPLPPKALKRDMTSTQYLILLRQLIDKVLVHPRKFAPRIIETVDCADITCPICMESFEDGDNISMCCHKHEVHSYCLSTIFESATLKKCCPLCRVDVFV